MIIKPNNEEDNKYIIKSFEKIIKNNKNNEKNIIENNKKKEDSNQCFQILSKYLANLKNNFTELITLFNEKKILEEQSEITKQIDEYKNILDKTIVKCYKYHDLVSDLEYDNLIFGDDTSMSTIEITRNLDIFPKIYSFKNRPNDIGFKKRNK